jgi:hypothetical protein
MDLLSLVSDVTKRKKEFLSRASKLALRSGTLDKLEYLTKKESDLLSSAFSRGEIRSEEFYRTLVDKTLVNSLASVYLGALESDPEGKMERAWPTLIGQMLPPLIDFMKDIEENLREGNLEVRVEEDPETSDFSRRMSWLGLAARVLRYIVNPSYSFFSLGEHYVRQEQGYRQMRRIPRIDDRTCPDCIDFGNLGWQPIGSLPMPGQQCRCYDRCRCRIEYR